MILKSIKYIRFAGKKKEWAIIGSDDRAVQLGNINLLVGKNAAGKSRTLNVLKEIGGLLSCSYNLLNTPFPEARYELVFVDNRQEYSYILTYEDKSVSEELVFVNGEKLFDRKNNYISQKLSSENISLSDIDKHTLAVSLHSKECPSLEKLYEWGKSLQNAAFTNQIEKKYLIPDLDSLKTQLKNQIGSINSVPLLYVFAKGKELYGDKFINNIIKDMDKLGYPIDIIDIMKCNGGYGLCVKESELDDFTDQLEMSQGMYRSLSLVVQLRYALMSKMSACILVDDLGEGLDFDRSKLLVDILINNIDKSNIQIFFTTNDRFVMNKLPLEFWSVIERYPHKSVFYNYYNSKTTFEDFKYTGLSNSDFLATDFYLKGFDGDVE
ncbi:MAG: AAA family ATPase [Dysgonomonas sp.]